MTSARRSFAGVADPARALVLVDGNQSVELVKAELSRRLAANAQGVDVLTAGRQGITIALRAVAQLGSEGGSSRRPWAFHFKQAGHEELEEHGLEPSSFNPANAEASGTSGGGRKGFRLSFLPRETPEASPDGSPVSKVLRVAGGTGQVLPLAKAVATEVARLPEGHVAGVETALRGKSKNLWTRIHRLAQAIAMAYEWQVLPKSPSTRVMTRRFRCTVGELEVSEDTLRDPVGQDQDGAKEDLLGTAEKIRVLRVSLVPEEAPQHTAKHRSGTS